MKAKGGILVLAILSAALLAVQLLLVHRSWRLEQRLAEVEALLTRHQDQARRPQRPVIPPPVIPLPLEGAAIKGATTAPVALIVYSDFQCPYCARFARDTMPALEKAYVDKGKLLLAFKHLPLDRIHPDAQRTAEAAECAGNEGQFWQMHDAIFRDPRSLDEASLMNRARSLSLDIKRFGKCLAGEARAKVTADAAAARRLGITGTPTVLVGDLLPGLRVKVARRLSGTQTFQSVHDVIEELLRAAVPSVEDSDSIKPAAGQRPRSFVK